MVRKTLGTGFPTGGLTYYKTELESFAKAVKNCDVFGVTDALDFFIAESNTHMAGLDETIQSRIRYYTRKFKDTCKCQTRL